MWTNLVLNTFRNIFSKEDGLKVNELEDAKVFTRHKQCKHFMHVQHNLHLFRLLFTIRRVSYINTVNIVIFSFSKLLWTKLIFD